MVSAAPGQEFLQRLRRDRRDGDPRVAGMRANPPCQPGRQLDREHRGSLRSDHPAGLRGPLRIPAGLPHRTPELPGQLASCIGHRHPGLHQIRGGIDALGILIRTDAITSHAINVLPDMSLNAGDTPWPFQPAVTQRDLEAEVIHCVGGVLSPLIFNIAVSALDEHVMAPWKPGGPMSTPGKRSYRRSRGAPTWRIIRYADDFVILVHGTREDTEALREDVARTLEPMGLRLSPAKTQVVHMGDGFDFLGFRIRWKRKRGTSKWYVYTFIADRPVRALRAKIRALTHKTSQWDLASLLTRLGQIMRGWAMYFRHAVAKSTFGKLDDFTFWRLAHMLRARHDWNWGQLRRHLTAASARWQITANGVEFFRIEKVTVSRYTYRGNKIPAPWPATNPA